MRELKMIEKLQQALTNMQAYYEDLLGSLQDGLVVVDRDLRVTSLNPAAEELLGISTTSADGKPLTNLLGDTSPLIIALVDRAFETGRAHAEHEASVQTPLGKVSVSAIASLLADQSGEARGVVLLLRDLTRIRELEEQVRRADRLTALGTLVTGIAHEIRNPLMGVRGAAQLIEAESSFPPALKEYTDIIIREVDRLNSLVEGMLAFAQPSPPRVVECNVNQIMEEILALEEPVLMRQGITVRRIYDPQVPPLAADPDHIRQVFLNLIRNGAEAMEGEGVLTLETGYERRSPRCFGLSVAVVKVVDQGPGLSPEVRQHLFDPFVTTKPKGTGLGLALCHRIVGDHRGSIEITDAEEGGCAVTVLLPLAT
ncbi:MAG: nitrogen regulation protein NR(II), partial [Candidatus Methylomirabilales bacterium]